VILKKYFFPLLFLLAACKPSSEKETDVFTAIDQEALANSQAYSALQEATSTIGHRLSGSENGTNAEAFAFNFWQKNGLEKVAYQEFEFEGWQRESLSLLVERKEKTDTLASVSLAYSALDVDLTAPVVDGGSGLAHNFPEGDSAFIGKVALIYLGVLEDEPDGSVNLHRTRKVENAINAGAKGVIFYNRVPKGVLMTGTASFTGEVLPIPVACISYENGFEIREQLSRGEPVITHVQMQNSSDIRTARNVIATIPGASKNDEVILIGGHLDSWDLAEGAIDNGIGAFAILDIARTFKVLDLKPQRTIKFVMFMGEEQGLFGSKRMVETMSDKELAQIKMMINIDMAGNPQGFNATGHRSLANYLDSIGQYIHQIDTSFENNHQDAVWLASDHRPFLMKGIPFTTINSQLESKVYDCYHADCDDFELVNEEHIRNTVRYTGMLLWALANEPVLPVHVMDSTTLRNYFVELGLEDEYEKGM